MIKRGNLKKRFLDPENIRAEKRQCLMRIYVEIPAPSPSAVITGEMLCHEEHWAIDYFKDANSLDKTSSTKSTGSLKCMGHDARSPPSRQVSVLRHGVSWDGGNFYL